MVEANDKPAPGPSKPGRYDFTAIEAKWQAFWDENRTFRSLNPGEPGADTSKPKFYILDMFPYPSGAGLHVGHPLGYCATDIIARYKRMNGHNVLHPMGFDAFGLPAEQYAIEHNVHPAVTTKANVETYRRQLKMFGFSYDWSREVATCVPEYYRFTQWIFLQMFNSWYDETCQWTDQQGKPSVGRARPVAELIDELESGRWGVTASYNLARDANTPGRIEWSSLDANQQREVVNKHRLAFIAEVPVNWCPALGTVLANEEVDNEGRSERGSHPVYRRPLRQWNLRITKYGDRLLEDLDDLDWPEPIKLMQRNWIGRSTGAEVIFPLADCWKIENNQWTCVSGPCQQPPTFDDFPHSIRVYTTRPDTLFGATYMVLAPEHPLVEQITTDDRREAVDAYVKAARNRSDLERTTDTKSKTGAFTGAYAINPVSGHHVPIWVADYVLMGYGTGAIMAVPGHDTRDFEFAKAFDLPLIAVVQPDEDWFHEQINGAGFDRDYCEKKGLGGLVDSITDSAVHAAATIAGITAQDPRALLDGDPGWVKQVLLPAFAADPGIFVESFTGNGISINSPGDIDGGASAGDTCSINGLPTPEAKEKITGWLQDRGVGVGAVNFKLRDWIFSRQKYWGEPFPVLHGPDGETVGVDESELPVTLPDMEDFRPTPVEDGDAAVPVPPLGRAKEWVHVSRDGKDFVRDLNTMPQWAGSCWYYLRFIDPTNTERFCDPEAEKYWMPIDLYVGGAEHAVLHLLYARFWHKVLFDLGHVSTREPFKRLYNQGMIQGFAYRDTRGVNIPSDKVDIRDDGFFHAETGEKLEKVIAKMSKSLKNVVNPDGIIAEYGADTFRMYEMYMGPLDAAKPWNTDDVPGLFRLCQRIWRLVVDEKTGDLSPALTDDPPTEEELRALHKSIKRVTEELEQLKLNTAIAGIFDFVNALTPMEKRSRAALAPFVLILSPFAPHLAEELWQRLGHAESLAHEPWPTYDPKYAQDQEVEIAVQLKGKLKARITVPADASEADMEAAAMADDRIKSALAGKTIRKVIVVKGRLVNIVAT